MNDLELAAATDAAALQVPGVRRLFAADPAPVRAARQVTAGTSTALPFSSVGDEDGARRVAISIEVDGARPAAEIAADVAARVRDATGSADVRIRVRVSRVAGDVDPPPTGR